MKLIDADKLEIDEIDGVRCYSILQVDEALPVQAIPIDILLKRIPQMANYESSDGQDLVMVADLYELVKEYTNS